MSDSSEGWQVGTGASTPRMIAGSDGAELVGAVGGDAVGEVGAVGAGTELFEDQGALVDATPIPLTRSRPGRRRAEEQDRDGVGGPVRSTGGRAEE
jgi:hypothetical protein